MTTVKQPTHDGRSVLYKEVEDGVLVPVVHAQGIEIENATVQVDAVKLEDSAGENEARVTTGGALAVAEASGAVVLADGTVVEVKRSFANVAASQTDANVVSAVASKSIRVLSVFALAGADGADLTFNSKPGGAGTEISPLMANGGNGGEVMPHNTHGWFETDEGEGLSVTTGPGSSTGILVTYVEVG